MSRRSRFNAVIDDVLQELENEFESEAFVGESGLSYPVIANRRYKVILGWDRYEVEIGRLLGFSNSSPTETLFAQSVIGWQASNGISPADGMIGPVTWERMRAALGLAGAPSAVPARAPAGMAQLVPLLNKYRGDILVFCARLGQCGVGRADRKFNQAGRTRLLSDSSRGVETAPS